MTRNNHRSDRLRPVGESFQESQEHSVTAKPKPPTNPPANQPQEPKKPKGGGKKSPKGK